MKTIENAPRLKIDDTLCGKDGKPSANGILERRIVWNLLKHLAAAGWQPVREVEENEKFSSALEAMELIFNLDEARIVFERQSIGDEETRAHVVLLVLGNGCDIVSDWNYTKGDPDGFNAAMEAFNAEAFA